MPSRALARRRAAIWRAVESVLSQEGVRAIPLVVINGPDRDPSLVDELRADRRLRVASIDDAGLPRALPAGRKLVDTPWFGELDDDDVLLPGALRCRLDVMAQGAGWDAVVTNGYRRGAYGDVLNTTDAAFVRRDPLHAMVAHNWVLPGSWLCRTDTIGAEFFEGIPPHLECTYLGLMFATKCRMVFVDTPTVAWYTDTPDSQSKSPEFLLGQAAALRRIAELDLPRDVRAAFRARVADAFHSNADLALARGSRREAWRWHLRSLREPGGWRYLPFTRFLIRR